jgi:hypothetical protein
MKEPGFSLGEEVKIQKAPIASRKIAYPSHFDIYYEEHKSRVQEHQSWYVFTIIFGSISTQEVRVEVIGAQDPVYYLIDVGGAKYALKISNRKSVSDFDFSISKVSYLDVLKVTEISTPAAQEYLKNHGISQEYVAGEISPLGESKWKVSWIPKVDANEINEIYLEFFVYVDLAQEKVYKVVEGAN